MFYSLSISLINILIKTGYLDQENYDTYLYAIEILILNGLILFSTLIFSILFNNSIHYICMIIFFVPLRIFAGGYHAKKSVHCFILTLGIYAASSIIATFHPSLYNNIGVQIVFIISCLSILIYAPLKNKNHILEEPQYKRNRKIIFFLISIDISVFAIFSFLQMNIATNEAIFTILVAILLVVGKFISHFSSPE